MDDPLEFLSTTRAIEEIHREIVDVLETHKRKRAEAVFGRPYEQLVEDIGFVIEMTASKVEDEQFAAITVLPSCMGYDDSHIPILTEIALNGKRSICRAAAFIAIIQSPIAPDDREFLIAACKCALDKMEDRRVRRAAINCLQTLRPDMRPRSRSVEDTDENWLIDVTGVRNLLNELDAET
jgi:hypothetical protein